MADAIKEAYEHHQRVYDIEMRESHGPLIRLWELHMLKSMTEEEFVNAVKTNSDFADKWGPDASMHG